VTVRQMHLNAFLMANGHHEAAWRSPGTSPENQLTVSHYIELARIAEAAKLDSLFLADVVALLGDIRFNAQAAFEPITLLSALATHTSHIGLISTASTNYSEPFTLARAFSSLDRISHGRAGWNVVTSCSQQEADNFGVTAMPTHAERYQRAEEFMEVVLQLWDSWGDDALVMDRDTGVYADLSRIKPIDHVGEQFHVAGPLNLPRSPQGRPLVVQAGSSAAGMDFAARHADAVFTAQRELAPAQEFYADLKAKVTENGRSAEEVLVLPGMSPIIGRTEAEAHDELDRLNALIAPDYGLEQLSRILGHDMWQHELDGPFPELPNATEGNQSRVALINQVARERGLTVRGVISWMAGARGHLVAVGTAAQVADLLEEWFVGRGADGFNIMPSILPGGLSDFAEEVVPELQRRGLFRTEYEAGSLRGLYGLPTRV
jgi:FMN-dependent oxidoreductase (nitrilotriacetate monooxygenase family)